MGTWWVKFWGVRGSVPVPGPTTVKYGGNTSCLEIRTDEGDWMVFDAGTGLRVLGESMDLSRKHEINIMISHPHWDHINGFPFFPPLFISGNQIAIYGPSTFEFNIGDVIASQMKYTYFPVRSAELQAEITYRDLGEESFSVGNYQVETHLLNHPVTCLGYKVIYGNKKFVYLGDNEPYYNVYGDNDADVEAVARQMNSRMIEFVRDADVLVTDAQYTPAEYPGKTGWGHSTTHHVVNMALKARVKKIFFFHHEPNRRDEEIDYLVDHYRKKITSRGYSLKIEAAMEGRQYEI